MYSRKCLDSPTRGCLVRLGQRVGHVLTEHSTAKGKQMTSSELRWKARSKPGETHKHEKAAGLPSPVSARRGEG